MTPDSSLHFLGSLMASGWASLLDYLAAHVLLCLLPAFVIAGFLSSMIPKEAITRFLGPRASRWISYPAAALGGFVLAVCSCTILPLFAGIWKRGAGLGPAITFLFIGPAVNILAITYTGAAIGFDVAIARLGLSILFGILLGLIMARVYRKEESARAGEMEQQALFEAGAGVRPAVWGIFALLIGILLIGTLQIPWLSGALFTLRLPVDPSSGLLAWLSGANLTLQGAVLVILLGVIALSARLGLESVLERFNRWTYVSIALVGLTLLAATPTLTEGSLEIGINGRCVGAVLLLAAIGVMSARTLEREELGAWLWETWRFVKQIFPLLMVGVFLAGMLRTIIPETWIQTLAGRNTLWANLLGVLFGVFMYFPTLVEVPIAKMFLSLGMARGPLLAYLLADPELSLQSILVLNGIMGKKKTALYVSLVAVFSTLAGYLFGLALTLL